MKKFFFFLISFLISITIVWATQLLPISGLVLPVGWGAVSQCGYPVGLPISYIETWRHLPEGTPFPLCVRRVNVLAPFINIIFWFILITKFLGWFFSKTTILKQKAPGDAAKH